MNNLLLRRRMMMASALPSGYKRLEYIESYGGAYLHTNVSGNCTIQFMAQSNENSTSNILSFATSTTGGIGGTYVGIFQNGKWGVGGTDGDSGISMNTKIFGNLSFNDEGVTGKINDINIERLVSVTQLDWYLFKTQLYNTSRFNGKTWFVKFYQNGVLVCNLIPALRVSDQEYGMYDTVGKTFLTNIGTGAFTGQ